MATGMDDRLGEIEARYAQVEAEIASPEIANDRDRLRDLGKAYAELGDIVGPYRELKAVRVQAAEARELARADADADMTAYLAEELERLYDREAELQTRLEGLLVPKDPDEAKSAIFPIRSVTRG